MKQLKQFDIVAILKPLNSEILQKGVICNQEKGTRNAVKNYKHRQAKTKPQSQSLKQNTDVTNKSNFRKCHFNNPFYGLSWSGH